MTNRAARTAFGPIVIVAIEQHEEHSLIQDELAYRFLPAGMKFVVRLTRWRPFRNFMFNGTERAGTGMWALFPCRKRYIDDKIRNASDAGIEAVVILGAGLDTRAYRLTELAETPVFEVDLPENIEFKRKRLEKIYGKVPKPVTLVPIDFESQDLASVLAEHGYQSNAKTFFVWEAVTQYLTEESVRKAFDFLGKAPTGSRLVFTYVRKDFIDGTASYGAEAAYQKFVVKQRLWLFGMAPERVAAFLAEYSWQEVEQAGADEFGARYVRPTGRVAPVSEGERAVYAEKT
ncbi:MAG: SAM-dependent methyltransferase [Pseudonocardiaceae bacterium]|nr:SAM-dependent methyltransferase [Pseudonocardiaceae bacterium]